MVVAVDDGGPPTGGADGGPVFVGEDASLFPKATVGATVLLLYIVVLVVVYSPLSSTDDDHPW